MYRIQRVRAVGGLRFAGPAGGDIAELQPVYRLGFNQITFRIFYRKVFKDNVLAIGNLHSFGALGLFFERQNGLFLSAAPNCNIVFAVQGKRAVQLDFTGRQCNYVAVFGQDHLRLDLFFQIGLCTQHIVSEENKEQEKRKMFHLFALNY